MGNGSLAFTKTGFGLENLYSEDEMIFFEDMDDLADKVLFYKLHSKARQKLAHKGWEKSHNAFSVDAVIRYILECLCGHAPSQTYDWPT